ncbi:LEA type 2 family protein [Thiococcus pfennigii]|jgi:LEA14-like dessication related protein|uniref:LEA type 2 family protein n=1 Tax=Thiococcus pfennigii TaxID=1057 RepID=UPI001908521B|nr:LEA type 2 family protein [Thiococcus pfennigii]MBK1702504.1 Water stress and hypersensitive response domain-containing protein [Thiococcus pfennigii]MBK1732279.1 Water stress and hypersensitive response domain-containing protein [Thiococcus pfennigii]
MTPANEGRRAIPAGHLARTAGLLALAGWLLALSGCAGLGGAWIPPEVELARVQPRAIALGRQAFLVSLWLRNPNDRTLPVTAMSYRIQLEGRQLAEGRTELERLIPPGGTEQVDFPVQSNLLTALPGLPQRLLAGEPLDWTVTGTVWIRAAGLTLPLPYRRSGQIDRAALNGGQRVPPILRP